MLLRTTRRAIYAVSCQASSGFVDGHARANRHKPSGIHAIESILRWHLVPTLVPKRLDAITNKQVQRLKLALADRAQRTAASRRADR